MRTISAFALVYLLAASFCVPFVARAEAEPPSATHTDTIINLFDRDKDGKLSQDEYAHGTVATFEALDQDADHEVEQHELQKPEDEKVKKADADKDGDLSFTEMLKHQEKAFQEKDADKDGFLSRAEIEKGLNNEQK